MDSESRASQDNDLKIPSQRRYRITLIGMNVAMPPSSGGLNVPTWAKAACRDGLDRLKDIDRVLHLTLKGVSMLQAVPRTLQVLRKYDDDEEIIAEHEEKLDRAMKDAEFVKAELQRGFPLVHAHAVVALWGSLEVMVEDLLVAWLVNYPGALENEALMKVKVPLAEYERLEKEERMRFLVRELQRLVVGKRGISQFEVVLDYFGLSGPVPEDARKSIFELNHVRNVLVHRASRADRTIAEACPWLGLQVGDLVTVHHEDYAAYSSACMQYLVLLLERLYKIFGIPFPEDE